MFRAATNVSASSSAGTDFQTFELLNSALVGNAAPAGRGGAVYDAGVASVVCSLAPGSCPAIDAIWFSNVSIGASNTAMLGNGVFMVAAPPLASVPPVKLWGPPITLSSPTPRALSVASGAQLPAIFVTLRDAFGAPAYPMAPNSLMGLFIYNGASVAAAVLAGVMEASVSLAGSPCLFANVSLFAPPGGELGIGVALFPRQGVPQLLFRIAVARCAPGQIVVGAPPQTVCADCGSGLFANDTFCDVCAPGCMCPSGSSLPCAQRVVVTPSTLLFDAGSPAVFNVSVTPPAARGRLVVCVASAGVHGNVGQTSFPDTTPGAPLVVTTATGAGDQDVVTVVCTAGTDGVPVAVAVTVVGRPCGEGAVANGVGLCEACSAGSWSWYQLPCSNCPEGASCSGGTDVRPLPGSWRATNTTTSMLACPLPAACHGARGNATFGDGSCEAGCAGPVCGVCAVGWGRTLGGVCSPCATPADNALIMTAMLLLVSCVVALLVWQRAAVARAAPGVGEAHVAIKKSILSHFQIMGSLLALRVPWPPSVAAVLHVGSATNSPTTSFVQWECVAPGVGGVVAHQVAAFMAPPALAALAVAFLLVRWRALLYAGAEGGKNDGGVRAHARGLVRMCCCARHTAAATAARWSSVRPVIETSLIIIVYLLYPFLVQRSLVPFGCTSLDAASLDRADGGHPGSRTLSLLSANYAVTCGSEEHLQLMLLSGAPMLLCYTVGIPAGLLLLLWRRRRCLTESHTFDKMGFLYSGYVPSRYWWEVVTMARKAAIVAVMVSLGQHPTSQVVSLLGVLQIALILQALLSPQVHAQAAALEVATMIVQCGTVMCALYTLDATVDVTVQAIIAWSAVLANAGVIARGVYDFARADGFAVVAQRIAPLAERVVELSDGLQQRGRSTAPVVHEAAAAGGGLQDAQDGRGGWDGRALLRSGGGGAVHVTNPLVAARNDT